jgi:hypothetical protein
MLLEMSRIREPNVRVGPPQAISSANDQLQGRFRVIQRPKRCLTIVYLLLGRQSLFHGLERIEKDNRSTRHRRPLRQTVVKVTHTPQRQFSEHVVTVGAAELLPVVATELRVEPISKATLPESLPRRQ